MNTFVIFRCSPLCSRSVTLAPMSLLHHRQPRFTLALPSDALPLTCSSKHSWACYLWNWSQAHWAGAQNHTCLSSHTCEDFGTVCVFLMSRFRTLILEHLEDQHIPNLLNSGFVMRMNWKEAVRSEQELQLQQLNLRHIQTHIYQPRLGNTHTR